MPYFFSSCSWLDSPSWHRPPHCSGVEITLRHTTLSRTPLDEWSTRRRDVLPDHTQHSEETDIHAPGGIRTVATQPWCSIMFRGHLVSCNHIKMIRTQQMLCIGKTFARLQQWITFCKQHKPINCDEVLMCK